MLSKLLRLGEGRMVKRLKGVADYVNTLSDVALLEWLQSCPPNERSAAPPVGTPSHPEILDEVRPVLAEWQRLAAKAEAEAAEEAGGVEHA